MTDSNFDAVSLSRSLGRIEGKQDLILVRLDAQARDQEKLAARLDKNEERLGRVEKKLNWYAAYIAGAGAVIGIIWYTVRSKVAGWIGG